MTAALPKFMFPAPVQRTVPLFSKVRPPVRVTALALARLSVTNGGRIVLQAPLIVPPLQVIWFNTVTSWLPLKVPLLRFTSPGVTVPVPLKLAVPLLRLTTAGATVTVPLKFAMPPEMTSVLFVQM